MQANVFTSSVIKADIKDLWSIIKNFNGLPDWYPGVIDSSIENNVDVNKVGCIRNFNRSDGLSFREALIDFDEDNFKYTYTLLEPAQPMIDYICTLRLLPVTDSGSSYIEWTAKFKCSENEEKQLCESLVGVFQTGFDALKKHTKNINR